MKWFPRWLRLLKDRSLVSRLNEYDNIVRSLIYEGANLTRWDKVQLWWFAVVQGEVDYDIFTGC